MKLSIALSPTKSTFAPLLFSGDMIRGIRRVATIGYSGIELNIRDTSDQPLDEIIKTARDCNMDIVALGTGQSYLRDGLYILSPDKKLRECLVDRLKAHIDFGARTGAKLILGGVFGKLEGNVNEREGEISGALDVVRRLAEYAAGSAVEIVIEPINRYETNFLNTIEQALAFISKVGVSGIKVLPDTFHMNIEEADPWASLDAAGAMIGHIHVADSNRMSPGRGHVDFQGLFRTLTSITYTGYLSGEFLPLPDDETAATYAINYLGRIAEANLEASPLLSDFQENN